MATRERLFQLLQICIGDVGGGDGEEPVDDDGYTLLTAVTSHPADDTFELASDDTHCVAIVKFVFVWRDKDIAACLIRADNHEVCHLAVWHYKGLFANFSIDGVSPIVEAEVREVGVVVDECLYIFFSATGEKNVEHAGFFYFDTFAIHHLECFDGGVVGLHALLH